MTIFTYFHRCPWCDSPITLRLQGERGRPYYRASFVEPVCCDRMTILGAPDLAALHDHDPLGVLPTREEWT